MMMDICYFSSYLKRILCFTKRRFFLLCISESWSMTKERDYFEASALKEQGRLCPDHVPEVYHFDRTMSLTEIWIARIYNTYGPRINIDDGRVVSNFIAQALRNEPLTVQSPGTQTRSFCYVSDMVDGLMQFMEGEHTGPMNIGNPGDFTMLELAKTVKEGYEFEDSTDSVSLGSDMEFNTELYSLKYQNSVLRTAFFQEPKHIRVSVIYNGLFKRCYSWLMVYLNMELGDGLI